MNEWRIDNPPINEDVLIAYPYEHGYTVAYYDGEEWYETSTGRTMYPVSWMPIPKYIETTNTEQK